MTNAEKAAGIAAAAAALAFMVSTIDEGAVEPPPVVSHDRYLCDAPGSMCYPNLDAGVPPYASDLAMFRADDYIEGFAPIGVDGGCIIHVIQTGDQHKETKAIAGGILNDDSCFNAGTRFPENGIFGRILSYPDGGA